MDVLNFFIHPILFAPLFACLSMGLASALIGVVLLYEKRSLVGEALSHAAYPGIVLGATSSLLFFDSSAVNMTFFSFVGACISTALGAFAIKGLNSVRGMNQDAALSFILSASFAFALLVNSALQSTIPGLGRLLQSLLMGQAATISDMYAYVCIVFALFVLCIVLLFYRSIFVSLFDREFASLACLRKAYIEILLLAALSLAVMIGVRTMGVVLLSSAFIFPALISRYLVRSLVGQFIISGIIGMVICAGGVIFSHTISLSLVDAHDRPLWIPTGPLIVLLFQALFMFIFLFSFKEGVIPRACRKGLFTFSCVCENGLKGIWKECSKRKTNHIEFNQVLMYLPRSCFKRWFVLSFLQWKGWLRSSANHIRLTPLGLLRGQQLVRLHRLWELYLVRFCGVAKERVHPQAEEMEHILTPEVEQELVFLLKNPSHDPHCQPIPPEGIEMLLQEKTHL